MWLMTKHGFYSIVQKPDGIHIRAREREDLERLRDLLDAELPGQVWGGGPRVLDIVETPGHDYRFRFITNRDRFEQVMVCLSQTCNYPNFKAQIDSDPSQRRKPYHAVWSLLARALGAYGEKGAA